MEQCMDGKLRDGTPVTRGPYYLYTYKDKGQTLSRRLTGPGEAEQYRKQIEEFRKFEALSRELIEVSQQIADERVRGTMARPEVGDKKKRLTPSSRRSRAKSGGSYELP